MLPGIDLRLQNVLKALREVVLPALPENQRLARDQAMLAIGHIEIVAEQWRNAARYEASSLAKLVDLAKALLSSSEAVIDGQERGELIEAVSRAAAADPANLAESEQLIVDIGRKIDAVILAAGRPGLLPPQVLDAVLAYGEEQAHRERVWFSRTKLDPDVGELESIEDMLADKRR